MPLIRDVPTTERFEQWFVVEQTVEVNDEISTLKD
jgi:hypothetical protein